MNKCRLIVGGLLIGLSGAALATDFTITNVRLDSLAIIAAPVGLHKAGNVEIAITGGFTPPANFGCSDHYWVTTLKTTDPDGVLWSMLNAIRSSGGTLTITDDPTLQAYPGRCSVRAAQE